MNRLKKIFKSFLKPLLYRFPPVFLSPAGLLVWFQTLEETKDSDGDIVEIGCYLGATAAMSDRLLKEIASKRQYIVIDTFGGFVDDQYDKEISQGGAPHLRYHFSGNSPDLARWVMDKHGGKDVRMIVGDITTLPDDQIPAKISACLLDIDLADPIYAALTRIYPRLVPGGVIVVDDCDPGTYYKARLGYERFIEEHSIASNIRYGKGIIRKV